MTLPASGPLTLGMVAVELGVPLPLSLGDPRVRNLAGKPSGPISLGDLYGKSAYTPMSITSYDDSEYVDSTGGGGTVSCSPYVVVTNGSGGYTYAWSFESNPQGCALSGGTTANPSVSRTYGANTSGSATATLQCAVTDNTGHTVVRGGITARLDWDH